MFRNVSGFLGDDAHMKKASVPPAGSPVLMANAFLNLHTEISDSASQVWPWSQIHRITWMLDTDSGLRSNWEMSESMGNNGNYFCLRK